MNEAFLEGFFKRAEQVVNSPTVDAAKAAQMQAGAMQSGWQPAQWKKNLMEGLGMGGTK